MSKKLKKHFRKHLAVSRSSKKGAHPFSNVKFSNPYLVIAILAVLGLILAANVTTTKSLVAASSQNQNVLGEDNKNEGEHKEEKKEDEKKQEERKIEESKSSGGEQKNEQKNQEGQRKEQEKSQIEVQRRSTNKFNGNPTIKSPTTFPNPSITENEHEKVKTEVEEHENKQETEIRTADGLRIKTKVEDGKTKIEIRNGELKLKYVVENGRVVLKAENEAGKELELEDKEKEKIEDAVKHELEAEGVKVVKATQTSTPTFAKNQIAAKTDFPLSIDVTTKQLIVTTPAGQKVVTVLPDQAVQNLLATGVINRVETPPTDTTLTNQLGTVSGIVKLTIRNNETVYEVNGVKTHRVLGFIPVSTPVKAFVSTETGTPVAQQQSVLTSIIDFLSP